MKKNTSKIVNWKEIKWKDVKNETEPLPVFITGPEFVGKFSENLENFEIFENFSKIQKISFKKG